MDESLRKKAQSILDTKHHSKNLKTTTNSVNISEFIQLLPGVIGAFFFPNKPNKSNFLALPTYPDISTQSIVKSVIKSIKNKDNSTSKRVFHESINSVETLILRKRNETLFVFIRDKQKVKVVTDIIEAYFLSHSHTNYAEESPNIINFLPQKNEMQNSNAPSRYTTGSLIGEGGTAFVYKAYDNRMQRDVALKRYKKKGEECESEENYRAELETAARIHHHNVVVSHDVNHDEKGAFIVMEYIRGENLETKVARAPMSTERFCDFAVQALEGLAATHEGGLLHLDIKPSNIMLAREGGTRDHVKIIDFGQTRAAKDPQNGKPPKGLGLHGSIYFCSPEYLKEQNLDARTDLYSLGCTFYWALTGQLPFDGNDPYSIMNSHFQHSVNDLQLIAPHLPKRLTNWIMSLIHTDCDRRPPSANQALEIFIRRRLANIHAPSISPFIL